MPPLRHSNSGSPFRRVRRTGPSGSNHEVAVVPTARSQSEVADGSFSGGRTKYAIRQQGGSCEPVWTLRAPYALCHAIKHAKQKVGK